ncbi:MAG: class I SAM-dependent methyltransferase [Thermomicrobiales bacterium]
MEQREQPATYVFAQRQARQALAAHAAGAPTATVSLDLEMTTSEVACETEGLRLPDSTLLLWDELIAVAAREGACYAVRAPAAPSQPAQVERIARFSEALGRQYSLYPTAGAPTLLIGGFSMHRIKETDPMRDTLTKVRAAAPLRGRVLDTSTGLGYTALVAARGKDVTEVVTIELDPTTLAIARDNPWSRELFTNPKIHQLVGDSYDVVPELPAESFSRIIHDPPIFSLAGELYSGAFYTQLFRVLRRGGRLFHYIGNLNSKGGGGVARGAMRRLHEAGFARVERRPEAFGVVAYKER